MKSFISSAPLIYYALTLLVIILIPQNLSAEDPKRLCEMLDIYECPSETGRGYNRSVGASMPTSSSAFGANPSALSMDKGFGLEVLAYGGEYDFSLISGTGRIGAGLSTSLPENSFFGNIVSENSIDYLIRMETGKKYISNKYNFATAFNLFGKKQNSFLNLNIGAGLTYNKITKQMTFGGGTSLSFGPISFGVASLSDYWQNYSIYIPTDISGKPIKYQILTTSWGLKLPFLAIDVAKIVNRVPDHESTINIFTTTLFYKSLIITYGSKLEISDRATYDAEKNLWQYSEEKKETFLGAQLGLHKYLLIGTFYNYYMLHEYSLGLTLFF